VDVSNASFVGFSLGGWVAVDYATRRPTRVAALSLISPAGIGRRRGLLHLKLAMLMLCGDWGLRRALRLVTGGVALPPPLANAMITMFREFRPRMERIPVRTDAELGALRTPVQLIAGARDTMLRSDETRDRLRRLVTNLEVVWSDSDGHVLGRRAEHVTAFLRRATAAAA
jgi:pimeloyl-ACP methyl ester carboxylesterase